MIHPLDSRPSPNLVPCPSSATASSLPAISSSRPFPQLRPSPPPTQPCGALLGTLPTPKGQGGGVWLPSYRAPWLPCSSPVCLSHPQPCDCHPPLLPHRGRSLSSASLLASPCRLGHQPGEQPGLAPTACSTTLPLSPKGSTFETLTHFLLSCHRIPDARPPHSRFLWTSDLFTPSPLNSPASLGVGLLDLLTLPPIFWPDSTHK